MNTVFSAMALLVMPLWFGMIVMPRARWTAAALRSPAILAPIALVYVAPSRRRSTRWMQAPCAWPSSPVDARA